MHESVGEEVQFAHAARQVEVVLTAVPQPVHAREHFVDERLRTIPDRKILARDVGEDLVVVGVEAIGDVIAGDAFAGYGGVGHPSRLAALSFADNGTQCQSLFFILRTDR